MKVHREKEKDQNIKVTDGNSMIQVLNIRLQRIRTDKEEGKKDESSKIHLL